MSLLVSTNDQTFNYRLSPGDGNPELRIVRTTHGHRPQLLLQQPSQVARAGRWSLGDWRAYAHRIGHHFPTDLITVDYGQRGIAAWPTFFFLTELEANCLHLANLAPRPA